MGMSGGVFAVLTNSLSKIHQISRDQAGKALLAGVAIVGIGSIPIFLIWFYVGGT